MITALATGLNVILVWFAITKDAELVNRFANAHDCAACRARADQVRAQLREYPEIPLILGILAH